MFQEKDRKEEKRTSEGKPCEGTFSLLTAPPPFPGGPFCLMYLLF